MIRSIGIHRLTRWGAAAFVLLLAQGLGAPPSARAACSHLVTSQADRRLEFHRLDELIAGMDSGLHADDPGRPVPAAPRKCSGPGCSSGVPWPLSTATPTSDGPDHWIVPGSVLAPRVSSPPHLVADEPVCRPAGHKPSIFHPPPA